MGEKISMQKMFIVFGVAAGIACTASPPEMVKEGERLLIRHPQYSLAIYPEQNGRTEITGLKGSQVFPVPGKKQELLVEVFNESAMEKQLPVIKYKSEEKNSGDACIVTLSAGLNAKLAGVDLDGVLLTRKIIVDTGKPYITVEVSLKNPGKKLRYASFGVRNRFRMQKFNENNYYLPTTRNVLEISSRGMVWNYYSKDNPWEYFPVAGWMAVNAPKQRSGMAFCMDYNYLQALYGSMRSSTSGWYFDGGPLPHGKTFTTSYRVIPVSGFKSLSFVSKDLIVGANPHAKGGKDATLFLASPDKVPAAMIDLSLYSVKSEKTVKVGDRKIKLNGMSPVRTTLRFPSQIDGAYNIAGSAEVAGKSYKFDQYVENGTRSQSIPALPLNIEYLIKAPEKIKQEFDSGISATGKRGKEALVFYGVYTEHYMLDKVLDGWKVEYINSPPARVLKFPPVSVIDDYSMIVFSDINSGCLTNSEIGRIIRYVKNGGNLLVLGGPYAYGQGRYHTSSLNKILPVKSAFFDLQPEKVPTVIRGTKDSGITVSGKNYVFWRHGCKPAKGTDIWMKTGDAPLLVVGRYGKGSVACLLTGPLGGSDDNKISPFWSSPQWHKALRQAIDKLYDRQNSGDK